MIWNDINIFKRDYTNGIKKLDGLTNDYSDLQNEKLKHKVNAFDTTPDIDLHGLDDKYTIRPFKLHYNQSLKDLFKNKSTPSNSLKGKVNLSTGTKEIIKMTNKMIPKIDHSTIDPGYYEHNLNEIKSNKDLMMREYSKAKDFAKDFIEDMKKKGSDKTGLMRALRTEKFETKSPVDTKSVTSLEPSPPPPPPPSEEFDEKTKRNKIMLTGKGPELNISPVKALNNSFNLDEFKEQINGMEDEFDNILKEEGENKERIKKKNERLQKFHEMAGKKYHKSYKDEVIKGAEETKRRREQTKTKYDASNKIKKFISNAVEQKKANKGKSRSEPISDSVAEFLEESDDDETEAEPKEEEPKSGGKKKKQSKDEKEESFNKHISSLTHEMLDAGIKAIDKEIEDYKDVNKKHVILKETSEDLNKRFGLYGLKFKTGTLVSSVLKKLNDQKVRLENQYGTGQLQGRLVDLKSERKKEDTKKAESKEV